MAGDFLGLQSDSNISELNCLLAVTSLVSGYLPEVGCLALRFFAFRKMLGCGLCKYHGSKMWSDFTAMRYHYFTQPLPNPMSYYAHFAGNTFHGFSVLMTFIIEVCMPFVAFLPRPIRYFACVHMIGINVEEKIPIWEHFNFRVHHKFLTKAWNVSSPDIPKFRIRLWLVSRETTVLSIFWMSSRI